MNIRKTKNNKALYDNSKLYSGVKKYKMADDDNKDVSFSDLLSFDRSTRLILLSAWFSYFFVSSGKEITVELVASTFILSIVLNLFSKK